MTRTNHNPLPFPQFQFPQESNSDLPGTASPLSASGPPHADSYNFSARFKTNLRPFRLYDLVPFLKLSFENLYLSHIMSLPFSNLPPAERVPYAIPQLEGERITIPGSKGVFRILTSSKQTNGLMAVFQSGATVSDAPGFHYHEKAHDVFLVTKGYLKLWNGPQCRILGPGDFAYIPPVRTSFIYCISCKIRNSQSRF